MVVLNPHQWLLTALVSNFTSILVGLMQSVGVALGVGDCLLQSLTLAALEPVSLRQQRLQWLLAPSHLPQQFPLRHLLLLTYFRALISEYLLSLPIHSQVAVQIVDEPLMPLQRLVFSVSV